MEDEEYGGVESSGVVRTLHAVVPWIALVAVAWAVIAAWGTFQHDAKDARSAGSSSESTTTASTTTTGSSAATGTAQDVVGLEAVARVALKLRSLPNDTSEILATAKVGDVLDILVKDAGHFKVKDRQGHVGWIPNSTDYITVRNKK